MRTNNLAIHFTNASEGFSDMYGDIDVNTAIYYVSAAVWKRIITLYHSGLKSYYQSIPEMLHTYPIPVFVSDIFGFNSDACQLRDATGEYHFEIPEQSRKAKDSKCK